MLYVQGGRVEMERGDDQYCSKSRNGRKQDKACATKLAKTGEHYSHMQLEISNSLGSTAPDSWNNRQRSQVCTCPTSVSCKWGWEGPAKTLGGPHPAAAIKRFIVARAEPEQGSWEAA